MTPYRKSVVGVSAVRPVRATGAVMLACTVLTACNPQQRPPKPPPPAVTVVTVGTAPVTDIIEVPGRIAPLRTAEVRARTDGIILRRLYAEGRDVTAGTPLFLIDPRDKQAAVTQARANLARAQAIRNNAAAVLQRYQPLVARQAISGQEFDAARAALIQADAGISDARAALERAVLELSYTTVRAPIAGRVGQALVTEGALVSAASATPLTTVNQMAPVYAVLSESSSTLTDLTLGARSRTGESARRAAKVTLTLENGQSYPLPGRLDFADSSVDPSTGSQILRAVFPNPDHMLLPGQFVRARIEGGSARTAVQIPTRAVQFSGSAASVMLIGPDGRAVVRPVTLGAQRGLNWIIDAGLKPGERLIVDGWQKLRPGQTPKILPQPAPPTAAR